MISLSYRGCGDETTALRLMSDGRERCKNDPEAVGVLLIADAHSYLMHMDMLGLLSSATFCLEYCEKFQLVAIADIARVLAGFASYQMNDLEQAENHLTRTDADLARMNYRHVVWGQSYLALTYAAQERWVEADEGQRG